VERFYEPDDLVCCINGLNLLLCSILDVCNCSNSCSRCTGMVVGLKGNRFSV
jgi:hypothetical protein